MASVSTNKAAPARPTSAAAGDCASQFQPLFGAEMRMESWQSANEQARIAATSMLGLQAAPAATPWFWTDQFGCNVQMLGASRDGMRYTWRDTPPGDAASPRVHAARHAGRPSGPCHRRQCRRRPAPASPAVRLARQ
ncbi:oxidoreductase C-terminal domain-containing protein [Cupriavidus basilensis]